MWIYYCLASLTVLISPVEASVIVSTIASQSKELTVPASPSNKIVFPLKLQVPVSFPDGEHTCPASWNITDPVSVKYDQVIFFTSIQARINVYFGAACTCLIGYRGSL
jgi:hypothetical protein